MTRCLYIVNTLHTVQDKRPVKIFTFCILLSLTPAIGNDVLYCTTTRENSLPYKTWVVLNVAYLSILVNYHTQKSHLNEAYSCETHRNLFFPGRKMADRHYNDSYEQYEEPYPYEGRDRMVTQILNKIYDVLNVHLIMLYLVSPSTNTRIQTTEGYHQVGVQFQCYLCC